MSEEDLDRVLNDKTVSPHWSEPANCKLRLDVQFVLFQNQLWVNRQSLVAYLDMEVKRVRENHIKGINEYWDDTKIEYLEGLKKRLLALSPEGRRRSAND